nr:BREX system ATP-binding domain-containing protein [Siccirubricoccus deserti]
MATRAKPEGGALASVLERFVADLIKDARERSVPVRKVLEERLAHLQEGVGC